MNAVVGSGCIWVCAVHGAEQRAVGQTCAHTGVLESGQDKHQGA